jgi:hypothetical protein
MQDKKFWALIQSSREDSKDCDSQIKELTRQLKILPATQIVTFDEIFRQKLIEADNWDFRGVISLIYGDYYWETIQNFCCLLIGQGETVFHKVLDDPQSLIDEWDGIVARGDDDADWEAMIYVARNAYCATTQTIMPEFSIYLSPKNGEAWSSLSELPQRFSRVADWMQQRNL